MTRTIDVAAAQGRLALIWITGASAVGLLLLVQTLAGKYGGQTERAWAWFVPTVVPTLTVIMTTWFETRPMEPPQQVEVRAFRVALGVSAVYLSLVAITLLAQPFTAWSPIELITLSHLWLGPVQGLAGYGVAKLFASKPSE